MWEGNVPKVQFEFARVRHWPNRCGRTGSAKRESPWWGVDSDQSGVRDPWGLAGSDSAQNGCRELAAAFARGPSSLPVVCKFGHKNRNIINDSHCCANPLALVPERKFHIVLRKCALASLLIRSSTKVHCCCFSYSNNLLIYQICQIINYCVKSVPFSTVWLSHPFFLSCILGLRLRIFKSELVCSKNDEIGKYFLSRFKFQISNAFQSVYITNFLVVIYN